MSGPPLPFGPPDGERRRREPTDAEREYLKFCLEFCDLLLSARPLHAEALQASAQHFTTLGRYREGLAADRRLAALFPEDPGVLYNLSCSLALTGDREEAMARLARAVELGYRDFRNMRSDDDLLSLRDDPRFLALLAANEAPE